MEQHEIIEMVRQAKQYAEYVTPQGMEWFNTYNERFAKLVAAKERDAIIDLVAMYGGPVDLEAAIRARGEA